MGTMKQLTTLDQPRLDYWYQQAINCPEVRPFLQHTAYTEEFKIQPSDWADAFFMDDASKVLMRLGIDRQRNVSTVRLYSLPGSQHIVVTAMQMLLKLHRVYGLQAYQFVIHDSNKEWLSAWMRRFPDCFWGIEPRAAYDMETKHWVGGHHFFVPVPELSRANLAWVRKTHVVRT